MHIIIIYLQEQSSRQTDTAGASEPGPGPGHGGAAPVLAAEHGALLAAQLPGPRLLAARAALLHRPGHSVNTGEAVRGRNPCHGRQEDPPCQSYQC